MTLSRSYTEDEMGALCEIVAHPNWRGFVADDVVNALREEGLVTVYNTSAWTTLPPTARLTWTGWLALARGDVEQCLRMQTET